jgi:hypothetical protein
MTRLGRRGGQYALLREIRKEFRGVEKFLIISLCGWDGRRGRGAGEVE